MVDYASILNQFGGQGGIQAYGWDAQAIIPVCEWDGISCDRSGNVVGIDLARKNLKGSTIPNDIGKITTLETFHLNETMVEGTIPRTVGDLPNLVRLNLGNNALVGTIPTFYSDRLEILNVSENALSGQLSPSFYFGSSGHSKLTLVDLETNQLTGTISEAVGTWASLETLSLSSNLFSGTIPLAFGVLASKELTFVYVNDNFFMGTIPEEFASPSSQLEEIWLHENLLSGTVPVAFADMPELRDFYVDGNRFEGNVPPEICTDEINADFFTDVYMQSHTRVELENECEKIACDSGSFSLEGMFPCSPCPEGQVMPYLGGEERCFFKDTHDVLDHFFKTTNGQSWTISNNWFHAGVDECDFTGIKCTASGHVEAIVLRDAGLSGTIPPDLGFLEHLTVLDLRDNRLTGFLPSDLRFAPLQVLEISGNSLRGQVPPLLCKIPGINDNGEGGEYKCDIIACPPGTANVMGRESVDEKAKCLPCRNGAMTLGLKSCKDYVPPPAYAGAASKSQSNAGRAFGIAVLVISTMVLAVVGGVYGYKRYKSRKEHSSLSMDDEVDRHIFEPPTNDRMS